VNVLLTRGKMVFGTKRSGITMIASLCISLVFSAAIAQTKPRVLVFTKTQGFDHGTRTVVDSLIRALGANNGFDVDTANDTGAYFKDAKLKTYATVCFINVTGNIFNDSTKAAFQRYIEAGGGYVGMHASVDCEYTWHWYHQLAGAYFANHHFGIAPAKLAVLSHAYPSTSWIAKDTITRSDEWYFFTPQTYDSTINPAILPGLTVLVNLVESSIPGSTENKFHPMSWCRQFDGGRTWYCGFGHYPDYFRDTVVQKSLLGGILWSAGMASSPVASFREPMRHAPADPAVAVYDVLGRKIADLATGMQEVFNSRLLWDVRDAAGRTVSAGHYYLVKSGGGDVSATPFVFTGR
jgi:type 1 glutamine amidotransferase